MPTPNQRGTWTSDAPNDAGAGDLEVNDPDDNDAARAAVSDAFASVASPSNSLIVHTSLTSAVRHRLSDALHSVVSGRRIGVSPDHMVPFDKDPESAFAVCPRSLYGPIRSERTARTLARAISSGASSSVGFEVSSVSWVAMIVPDVAEPQCPEYGERI